MLISDDPNIAAIWALTLQQAELVTCQTQLSEDVIRIWAEEHPDMIVIDSQAYQSEELELYGRLRHETIAPILLFTPRNDETFLLDAYKVGIDDVVTQTISPRLFLAKVNAWLRRARELPKMGIQVMQVSGMRLDPNKNIFWRDANTPIYLTYLEVRLLYYLMSHKMQIKMPRRWYLRCLMVDLRILT